MDILFASGTEHPVRTHAVKFPVVDASETLSQLARFSGEDGGIIRVYAIHSAVESLERCR